MAQNTHFPVTSALPVATLQLYYMNTGFTDTKEVRRRLPSFHSPHTKATSHDEDRVADHPKELSRRKSLVQKIKRTFSRKSKKGLDSQASSRPTSMVWYTSERHDFDSSSRPVSPASDPGMPTVEEEVARSLLSEDRDHPSIIQVDSPTSLTPSPNPIANNPETGETTAASEEITDEADETRQDSSGPSLTGSEQSKGDVRTNGHLSPSVLANDSELVVVRDGLGETASINNNYDNEIEEAEDESSKVLETTPELPMFLPFRVVEEESVTILRPVSVHTDVSSSAPPSWTTASPSLSVSYSVLPAEPPPPPSPAVEFLLGGLEEEEDHDHDDAALESEASSSLEGEFFSAVERVEKNEEYHPPATHKGRDSESATDVISTLETPHKTIGSICKPFIVAVASLGVFAMAVPVVSRLFRR